MRSEISYISLKFLRRRLDYISDVNRGHASSGIHVEVFWNGATNRDEFLLLAQKLSNRPRGRGAPLRYVALEITAHPADQSGATAAFLDQSEMLRTGAEVLRQMHARVAVIACHGLRDIHLILLNDGPSGKALKNYLPNRSNPRRVVVATLDRIEEELNLERLRASRPKLVTMRESRAAARMRQGRSAFMEGLLQQISPERKPDVAAILKAFRRIGFRAEIEPRNKLLVQFQNRQQQYDLDLFVRGVIRCWRERSRRCREEQRALSPPFEAITAGVYSWASTRRISAWMTSWVEVIDGTLVARPNLVKAAQSTNTHECRELLGVLSNLQILQSRGTCVPHGVGLSYPASLQDEKKGIVPCD